MAARSFVQLLGAADPGVVLLGISWQPNGTGAVPQSTIAGRGVASVARSGTGTFVVTLQDVYSSLLSATATLQLASADDKIAANIGAVSVTGKTYEVRLYDLSTGALTDIALDPGTRVNLLLVLKNSQV